MNQQSVYFCVKTIDLANRRIFDTLFFVYFFASSCPFDRG